MRGLTAEALGKAERARVQRAMCRFASRYGQKTIATCIPHG